MNHTPLSRAHRPIRPQLTLFDKTALDLGRVHEICGTSRRVFPLLAGQNTQGPILWIRPAYISDHLFPSGVAAALNPGRFIFVNALRQEDLLWSMEEALRSGAISLVVADLPFHVALTPIRRLHLAAQASGKHPLALLLTPEHGGSQGVETRWTVSPRAQWSPAGWSVVRNKSRDLPPQEWHLFMKNKKFQIQYSHNATSHVDNQQEKTRHAHY